MVLEGFDVLKRIYNRSYEDEGRVTTRRKNIK